MFIITSGRLASPARTLQQLIQRGQVAGYARVQGTVLPSTFVKAVIQCAAPEVITGNGRAEPQLAAAA
ncbi:hypothetical protein AB0215_29830, partial [Klebsiella pneumoniae]